MSKIFSADNKFFTILSKIVDMLWLSTLWSLCCLPLIFLAYSFLFDDSTMLLLLILLPVGAVTTGPASAALYYAVVKSVRHDRSYVTKCFFHAFKVNFKYGALSSLIFGFVAAVVIFDIIWAPYTMGFSEDFAPIIRGVFMGMGVFVVLILVWVNPLLSRFEIKLKDLIKNSMALAIKNIFRTLLMAALWIGIGYVLINFQEYIWQYMALIPFVLPSVSALVRSFIIEPVFKKITGDPNEDADKEVDAWYAE